MVIRRCAVLGKMVAVRCGKCLDSTLQKNGRYDDEFEFSQADECGAGEPDY